MSRHGWGSLEWALWPAHPCVSLCRTSANLIASSFPRVAFSIFHSSLRFLLSQQANFPPTWLPHKIHNVLLVMVTNPPSTPTPTSTRHFFSLLTLLLLLVQVQVVVLFAHVAIWCRLILFSLVSLHSYYYFQRTLYWTLYLCSLFVVRTKLLQPLSFNVFYVLHWTNSVY